MPLRSGPAPDPEVLADRLDRMASLPLRPVTVRAVLGTVLDRDARAELDLASATGRLDPGWALRRLRSSAGPVRDPQPLSWVADDPGWTGPDGRLTSGVSGLLDQLWRHSVVVGLAAGRLAEHAGLADAGRCERIGLLQGLGLWALAATVPDCLIPVMRLDPPLRRARLRADLGIDPGLLGRRLAVSWGAPADLVDATWLAEPRTVRPSQAARYPDRLAPIRDAYRLAELSRWSLWSDDRAEQPRDRRIVAWLEAEAERLCAPGFLAESDPFADRLAREHARLRLQQRQEQGEQAQARALLVEIAGTAEAPPHSNLVAAAREAWLTASEDRIQLDRLLTQLAGPADCDAPEPAERPTIPMPSKLDALAEFAAGAGHELNNPLAVILGRAQILLARTTEPEAGRALRAIIGQAQRAHRILRDLMYVARPPAPRPRLTQPLEIVRASLRDLKGEAEARGLQLMLDETVVPGPRSLDPDALRHLTDTLVLNALEASPPGGMVRVGLSLDPDRLVLQVEDDGRGLNPDQAEHLLDPFFCGRQAGRGLGLGLPRVARYLDLAGGQLAWQPNPEGRGTIFTVELPIGPTIVRLLEPLSGETTTAEAG